MDFFHDVHDWLGGYPYESISFEEMQEFMKKNNFKMIRSFQVKKNNYEYVFILLEQVVTNMYSLIKSLLTL